MLVCDALRLPYRDESFDAALSVAVLHHLATRDRRVRVLRELARVLRVGGRVLITVWAKEQRHRKVKKKSKKNLHYVGRSVQTVATDPLSTRVERNKAKTSPGRPSKTTRLEKKVSQCHRQQGKVDRRGAGSGAAL